MRRILTGSLVLFFCASVFGTAHTSYVQAAAPTITAPNVFIYTNIERYRAGVPLLTINTTLSAVAMRKMQDLFARQYFAHESPTGQNVGDLVKDAGYEYLTVGENLALGDFTSSKEVVTAWMNSPGHRKNMLSPAFTEIGIAAGRSVFEGHSAWIIVQTFGTPESACPTGYLALTDEIDTFKTRLGVLERIAKVREQAASEGSLTRTELTHRVAAYNSVVDTYNETVDQYKKLVVQFNEGVDTFNACLKNKVGTTSKEHE